MEITEEQKDRVLDIVIQMNCKPLPCKKNYACYKSSFDDICEVKSCGDLDGIECESPDAKCCNLSFSKSSPYLCTCPMRRYIFENFNR